MSDHELDDRLENREFCRNCKCVNKSLEYLLSHLPEGQVQPWIGESEISKAQSGDLDLSEVLEII